jgi:NADH-quinone oxidoreductase subunit K
MIPITHILVLAGALFFMGLVIVVTKRNAIMVLIGIELMLNGANLNLIAFSTQDPEISGQMFSLFVILIAAAEAAVALALIRNVYKYFQTSNINEINQLKPGDK